MTSSPARPTISLCVIARNEADTIGRCLAGTRDFVDEMIVVDTGSCDDTAAIARSLGARVHHEHWRDDFAAARNASLDLANGDWILFLDCDEELSPGGGPVLRDLIGAAPAAHEAYFVMVSNDTGTDIELVSPSIRIFRRRPEYRFAGRIHEQIADAVLKRSGAAAIGQSDVTVIHHGYNATTANIRAKVRRNLQILLSYPEESRDGFFYYNLGIEHLRLGERRAALENFVRALPLTSPSQAFGPILIKRTLAALMDLERFRDALEQIGHYQGIYVEYRDLALLEAVCHLRSGRYSKAEPCLRRYLEAPASPAWYPTENTLTGEAGPALLEKVAAQSVPPGYPSVSLCVIGRDEEESVAACIRSANEIAAEVIFVDTGSTDRTTFIAHQLGATVRRFPWTGSFADARNEAIGTAKGQWILFLDADEMLADDGRAALASLLRNALPDGPDGYLLRISSFLDERGSPAACQVGGSCRLFRNSAPGYRYRGAAGEEIVSSIVAAGGRVVPVAGVDVHHLHHAFGRKRVERMRTLKAAAIAREEAVDACRGAFLRGAEAFRHAQFPAAVAAFDQAIALAAGESGAGRAPPAGVVAAAAEAARAGSDFHLLLAMSLLNAGETARAAAVTDEGISLHPDYFDLVYLRAIAFFQLGAAAEAEDLLLQCLEAGDAPWEKYTVTSGTANFRAMCSLASLYGRSGRRDDAVRLFLQAMTVPGGRDEALSGLVTMREVLPLPIVPLLAANNMLNVERLWVTATFLVRQGSYKEAIDHLSQAVDLLGVGDGPSGEDCAGVARALSILTEQVGGLLAAGLPKGGGES
jgi:glycosyltransferase involved in cell wall biosynthesis